MPILDVNTAIGDTFSLVDNGGGALNNANAALQAIAASTSVNSAANPYALHEPRSSVRRQ
jgi:hypothetical protein